MRRHARPALLALLVASGIGLARPGDLGLVTGIQGTGAALQAVSPAPAPAATSVAIVPASSALAPSEAVPATSEAAESSSAVPASPGLPAPSVAASSPDLAMPSAAPTLPPDNPAPTASALAAPPAAAPPVSSDPLTAGADIVATLPAAEARRRAQTWDPVANPADLTGYVWPLPHGRITDPFGPSPWGSRVVDGQLFHDGLDIATFCGDRVLAAHDGTVLAAGRRFDEQIGWIGDLTAYFGRLDAKQLWWTLPISIVIDDGNGYRSIYAHFSQVAVKVGQRVKAGQLIGYEGATGRATGCHVHYGLFAPHETTTIAIEPSVAKRMLVPGFQIMRIDPLRVLPQRQPGPTTPDAPPAQVTKPVDLGQ